MSQDLSATGWFSRLKSGLSKTRTGLVNLFTGRKLDEALLEQLEEQLIMADCGVAATELLMAQLRKDIKRQNLGEHDGEQLKTLLRDALVDLLRPLEVVLDVQRAKPTVMMVVGVNGAGKTTSIGKLAQHFMGSGHSVLLAAGDTFRAAAREQLNAWALRTEVDIVSAEGSDPAALAFDAVQAAVARGKHIVIADTAGRLSTQLHLMEELKKIKKVIHKALPGAPHEVVLVLDATNGQNALLQVKAFHEALGLTALVVTKLDGTAKGGVLAALAATQNGLRIPVAYIGVGEQSSDLKAFRAFEYSNALLGIEPMETAA